METSPGAIIPQVVPDPPRRQYGLIVTATISLLGLPGLAGWFLGNLTDRNERLNHLVVSQQEEIGSLTRSPRTSPGASPLGGVPGGDYPVVCLGPVL